MNDKPRQHPLIRLASQYPFATSMCGAILFLLCFPPVGWWPLAWIAPVPFVALIATPGFQAKRPMRSIWFSGMLYWAAEVYYVTIPHPALWIAWILLFAYLSIYPVLFVWIGRKFVQDQRISILLAAPIAFTALEWVRAHMLSGFGFAMLANSQFRIPVILQTCDIAGAYGLTFIIVLFATGLFVFITNQRFANISVCLLVVAWVLGYGTIQLRRIDDMTGESINIVVVQGNIDTRFPKPESEKREYQRQLLMDYLQLLTDWQKANDWPVPDLVVWPEGKYPIPHMLPGGNESSQATRRNFRSFFDLLFEEMKASKKWSQLPAIPPMIVGAQTIDPERKQYFNSALLLGNRGQVVSAYHKVHLVMFGEYIPFIKWFPILGEMTPIETGLNAGVRPVGFNVGGLVVAPNICFESSVAHLVRESVVHLRSLEQEPDLLVNITDDGWFYGHSVLDHHLACNVIRSVENRKPGIVAANTGLSAFIQSTGEILLEGPRRKSQILELAMPIKPLRSVYSRIGDWPTITLTILCVMAILLPPRK